MNRVIHNPALRFVYGVSTACGVMAVLAGLLWYGAVIDQTPPVSGMKGEVVSIAQRKDGSRLMVVRWTGIRERHCVGSSQRWLRNGYIHPLPPITFPPRDDEKIGDPVDMRVAVEIPADFPAHKGIYQIVSTYQCNLIQLQFPSVLSVVVSPPPVTFDLSGDVQ